MINTEGKPFVVLRGLEKGNVFWSCSKLGEDSSHLIDGTLAYEVIGYCSTDDEAKELYEKHVDPNALTKYIIGLHKKFGDESDPCVDELMREMERKLETKVTLKNTDFVHPVVSYLDNIPADSNPFNYDAWRMGGDLIRGWMAMYEGFDTKENPLPLNHLILVNTRTGQRIRLDFKPYYQYRNASSADATHSVSGVDLISGGSGVLEWCNSESEAKEVFIRMSKYDWQFKDLTIFDERCSLEVLKKSYNNVCSVCTGYGCLTCNESGETKP